MLKVLYNWQLIKHGAFTHVGQTNSLWHISKELLQNLDLTF